MKDITYQIISIVGICASFIPMTLVLIKNLWKERALVLFASYWLVSGLIGLIDRTGLSKESMEVITVVYNMLDMPIVLGIIYFTTTSVSVKKFTRIAAPGFLAIQLVNFFVRGWRYEAAKYVLALGILLVLFVVTWEIYRYMSKLEHSLHEKAMIFIHVSLLFAYGTFVIIYIFDYFVNTGGSSVGNFIVYYISTSIAILIACLGFLTKSSSRSFI